MAWLFGSRKSKQVEVYVSNEVEGGFNVVSLNNPQTNRLPTGGGGVGPNPGSSQGAPYPPASGAGYPSYPLYPTIPPQYPGPPYLAVCPQAPPGYKPTPQHPMDSIPFKLSGALNSSSSSSTRRTLTELESIRSCLDRVEQRIKSNEYSYSFELERSVLREMTAGAN